MALVLDATPGSSTANSYATRAQGDTYHEAHIYATAWTGATAATKDAALVWATRILDEQVLWYGSKRVLLGALRWPRSGVEDRDGINLDFDTIPQFLINATAELARSLIDSDRTAEPQRGMGRLKVDVIEIEYDRSDRAPVLPPAVIALVDFYGEVRSPGTAKLVRT